MHDRDRLIAKLMLAACAAGGLFHFVPVLLLPFLTSVVVLVLDDRDVHRRMGRSAWPSIEYARFLFGTNLYLVFRNTVFGAALFAVTSTGAALLGH